MSQRESLVLLPGSSLEDLPTRLDDTAARGLLAAITVAHHPQILAETGTLPSMGRADSPPIPDQELTLWVPDAAASRLADDYLMRAESEGATLLRGTDRESFEAAAGLTPPEPLREGDRTLELADFYAAAYALLQVRLMTRRLRYTSNLDEIHLQNRLVAAAEALTTSRDAAAGIAAMHDVFDALAEERDHYFSSDPHLIDLTLVAGSVADRIAKDWSDGTATSDAVPVNLLADVPTLQRLLVPGDPADPADPKDPSDTKDPGDSKHSAHESESSLAVALRSGDVGLVTGGPPADTQLSLLGRLEASRRIADDHREATRLLGKAPEVYGRLGGETPADLAADIVRLGYDGIIPIDFASGGGSGEEAKVLLETEAGEIEALTSVPIDATSDAAFVHLAPRLGTAIDNGEIATALLVHWPGQVCASMHDLRRAASWGLALGKFWNVGDYFRNGEKPYHHGSLSVASPDAVAKLRDLSETEGDAIGEIAAAYRTALRERQDAIARGIAGLAHAGVNDQTPCGEIIAAAVGAIPCDADASPRAALLFNPLASPTRHTTAIAGGFPEAARWVYAATKHGTQTDVTADLPAGGFAVVRAHRATPPTPSKDLFRRWGRKLIGGGDSIAGKEHLQNEFLEFALHPESGGILGLFGGQSRGNRMSMRLVVVGDEQPLALEMICDKMRVTRGDPVRGCIQSSGRLVDGDQNTLAKFQLTYRLDRGTRTVHVTGDLDWPAGGKLDIQRPWSRYAALRVATPNTSPSYRWHLRDAWHRLAARRVVAPGGYMIEEPDGRTLVVATGGHAYHRRVGDRFVDTLLTVGKQAKSHFEFALVLDPPHPASAIVSALVPPIEVPVEPHASLPETGYLAHVHGRDAVLLDFRVKRNGDAMDAEFTLLQTRSRGVHASVRFCHTLESAEAISTLDCQPDEKSSSQPDEKSSRSGLQVADDCLRVSLDGHQARRIRVRLRAESR